MIPFYGPDRTRASLCPNNGVHHTAVYIPFDVGRRPRHLHSFHIAIYNTDKPEDYILPTLPDTHLSEQPDHPKPRIFICYSRADVDFVQLLDAVLQSHAVETDLDLRFEITPDYREELEDKLLRSDAILFIISPSSVTSENCRRELLLAAAHNKRILAILHRDGFDNKDLLPQISKPEWLFMRTRDDLDHRLPALLTAINTDFELMRMHTLFSLRAREWEQSSYNKHFLLRGPLLVAAQQWLPKASRNAEQLPNPTELQSKYILASQTARSTFIKTAAGVVLVLAVALGTLGLVAIIQAREKESALHEKESALTAEEKARKGEQDALLAKGEANIRRERAELDRQKAAVQAQLERERAEREILVDKANRTVLVGERIVEKDPAKAISFALASTEYSPELAAQTLIRRAAMQLPEFQIIPVEQRRLLSRPEILPSGFQGLRNLHLVRDGSQLVIEHLDGSVTIWSVGNGTNLVRIGGPRRPIADVLIRRAYPSSLFVLYKDGSVERLVLNTDGAHSVAPSANGPFTGLAGTSDGLGVIAWTSTKIATSTDTPAGWQTHVIQGFTSDQVCTQITPATVFICLDESHALSRYSLQTGDRTVIYRSTFPLNNGSEATYSGRPVRPKLTFLDSLHALVVTYDLKTTCQLEVIDLDNARATFVKEYKSAVSDVDIVGGKLAVLDNHSVKQFVVTRSGSTLTVDPFGEWEVTPEEGDVGEAHQIIYGPNGKYLLTANAPILTLVGARPATVKLWYANPYADGRAGDLHRGKVIGSQSQAVFNVTFDETGRRIATFDRQGIVRVWDIFPEASISPQTKSDDFFNNYYHLPVSTRALLNADFKTPKEFFQAAQHLFKIRLSNAEADTLKAGLNSDESGDTIFGQLPKYTPPTIALQWPKIYDKGPYLVWRLSKGYDQATGRYDPLRGSARLADLLSDIIHGLRDVDDIIDRYISAAEDDALLVTGLQIPPLVERLRSEQTEERKAVYVMLALSGDSSVKSTLRFRVETESDKDAKGLGLWAVSFLGRYGRDLSLHGELALHPELAKQSVILSLPTAALESGRYLQLLGMLRDEQMVDVVLKSLDETDAAPSLALVSLANQFVETTAFQRRYNFVIVLRELKAYDAALAWCRPLLREKQTDLNGAGVIENVYGYLLYLLRRYEESILYFKRSLAVGRTDGFPELNWGLALLELDRGPEARRQFEASIGRGEVRMDAAKNALNGTMFERFLEEEGPNLAKPYNELAWQIATSAKKDEKDLDYASGLALKASQLTGRKDSNILDTLAHVDAAMNRYDEAIEVEMEALRVLPRDSIIERARLQGTLDSWKKAALRSKR
jgi:tetratricopeptide (TPR) repeat protein/WD40 repeat protein